MEVNLTHWRFREELSLASRLRRSYYEILRDDLDQLMIHQALIESYTNFVAQNIPFRLLSIGNSSREAGFRMSNMDVRTLF